ncbi:MAG: cytochrome c biogenesis protein CcsA [Candidatus Paracaedibacteraceae bacterium]|nr:cytochrome c biogenesis protein CcsA [Candidatus Paracaedibacteraceae bacterium]
MELPYLGQGLLLVTALFLAFSSLMPRLRFAVLATLLSSFILLVYAHVASDFSFVHVVQYSHTTKPLLYKISGIWGNHEGSMLLWLVLFYSLGSWATRHYDKALAWVTYIALAITLFMIMACNPFQITGTPFIEGQDLNPLLQDPLLAIHPPLLYLGVVASFIPVLLALSIAPLQTVLFWTVFSWTFMAIGISLGSFWAYYELGWGGWWFWDPVENAALVPWLLQTAALHSQIKNNQRPALVFGFLSMASSLIGTFIIRSGLVTSVHSFAIDPERGLFLALVCGVVLIPLAWSVMYQPAVSPQKTTLTPLRIGVYLLSFSAFVVAFGTLYPIILSWFGHLITVGAPYFNKTVVPVFLGILLLMAFDPWHKQRHDGTPALLVSGASTLALWYYGHQTNLFILLGFATGIGLCSSMILGIRHRQWAKAKTPMILAHFAVGLAAIGIALSTGYEEEKLIALKVHEATSIHGIPIRFTELRGERGDNFMAQTAILTTDKGNLAPEKRFYITQKIIHPETAIQSRGLDHLYVTLGDRYDNDSWGFRLTYKPWINLMWLGFVLLGIAGLLSLTKRWWLLWVFALWIPNLQAIEIHEQLSDPVQERRAVILGAQLLCPTCNGQPLNESSVEEAELLRSVIRQQLKTGYTDQQVIDWFVDRYGERVLVSPPLNGETFVLWGLPWIILLSGIYIRFIRNKKTR